MKPVGTVTQQLRHVVESSGRGDARIAIVDRHLLLADGLNALLRVHGFRCAVVVPDLRSLSVLGFIVGMSPEVAVIDIDGHPGPSNLPLVSQLVRRGIAVIGITAGISAGAQRDAFEAGAVGIITTGDRPEQLVELILGVTTAHSVRPRLLERRQPAVSLDAQRSELPRRTAAGQ